MHGAKLWLDLSAWCVGIGGGGLRHGVDPVTSVPWALTRKCPAASSAGPQTRPSAALPLFPMYPLDYPRLSVSVVLYVPQFPYVQIELVNVSGD